MHYCFKTNIVNKSFQITLFVLTLIILFANNKRVGNFKFLHPVYIAAFISIGFHFYIIHA